MPENYLIDGLGDCAVLLRAPSAAEQPDWIAERERWLRSGCPGLLDAVPAGDALALYFHADWVATLELPLAERLPELLASLPERLDRSQRPDREHRIPVCYGGAHGPDLGEAARRLGMPEDELVRRHLAGRYRVRMLGFLPGFAYLDGLDPALELARHARPRESVAAGSVGIGGRYTGIYPRRSPGGWQLIGRTPVPLFDPARDPPCRLLPDETVCFFAIDAEQFARLEREREALPWR